MDLSKMTLVPTGNESLDGLLSLAWMAGAKAETSKDLQDLLAAANEWSKAAAAMEEGTLIRSAAETMAERFRSAVEKRSVKSSVVISASDLSPEVMGGKFFNARLDTGEHAFIPVDDVGVTNPEREELEDFVDDPVLSYKIVTGFGSRLGKEDWSFHNTEMAAWEHLIDEYPEAFEWSIENGMASILMESKVAAEAMRNRVRSLAGSETELDENMVYAMTGGSDEDIKMMTAEGMSEEDAVREAVKMDQGVKEELEEAGFSAMIHD